MHHRGIFAVGDDSGEAFADIMLLLGTEFGNLLRTFPFGYRFAFFQRLKQPAVEFCFGTAILEVGKASVGNLGFVFDRFHHRDRVYPFDKGQMAVILHLVVQQIVYLVRVAQHVGIGLQGGQEGIDVLIFPQGDTIFGKLFGSLRRYTGEGSEQNRLVAGYKAVRNGNRAVGDVVGTDVKEPVAVVQSADDQSITTLFSKRVADLGELLCCRFTAVFFIEVVGRGVLLRRAVFPDVVAVVGLDVQGDSFLSEQLLHLFHHAQREQLAVESDNTVGSQVVQQILAEGRAVRFRGAEQHRFTVGNLSFCLHIVSTIHPKSAGIFGDDIGPDRAGEAGNKAAGLPMLGKIFAHVRVAAWDDDSLYLIARHQLTDAGNLFICSHCTSPPRLIRSLGMLSLL